MISNEERQRVLDMLNLPTIASQLPVTYPGSLACWDEISGFCRKCRLGISENDMHGNLTRNGDMVELEAVGVCHPCHLISTFKYRLYPEYITGIVEGRWVIIHGRRTLRGYLRSLAGKVWKLLDDLGLYNRTKPPK